MSNAAYAQLSEEQQSKLKSWNPTPQQHEKDGRWSAVDEYTISHLHTSKAYPDPTILEAALTRSTDKGLPKIEVSPTQGKWLMLQARMINAKNVLEVGTLGGYSTIWLASASKDVRVTTIEVDPEHADVARENFSAADVRDRIDVLVGAGLDVLPRLIDEVTSGTRPPFDMVFIDADKVNSWNYFDLAVKMSRAGALVIVDNVVRRGFLVDEEKIKTDTNIQGNRLLVENTGKDPRVDAVVLQLVSGKTYDGVLIATVH